MNIEPSGSSNYYENHHIIPRSLNGSNSSENLVLLTAREHFICHWLLVKIFPKGSDERRKMLFALWSMRRNPTQTNNRYLNSRTYEKLRLEYVSCITQMMKVLQTGQNNSIYGLHWFTNRNTGEVKLLDSVQDECWVKGKNLCRGESSVVEWNKINQRNFIRRMWNKYHSENWSCVSSFAEENGIVELRRKFRIYIPYFKRLSEQTKHNRFNFPSNKKLIDVFE